MVHLFIDGALYNSALDADDPSNKIDNSAAILNLAPKVGETQRIILSR